MDKSTRRVFVGGLSSKITEATLMAYFSNFGEIDDCFIVTDSSTGCSRGYGFVSFIDSAMAEQALAQHHHSLLGRKVDVKPAMPRVVKNVLNQEPDSSKNGASNTQPNGVKKIFVGGLPENITIAQFRTYFESYGLVEDAVVVHDMNGEPRGFGFITFESECAASDVLKQRFHVFNGKNVEVKRADPMKRIVQGQFEIYDCCNTGLPPFHPQGRSYSYPSSYQCPYYPMYDIYQTGFPWPSFSSY